MLLSGDLTRFKEEVQSKLESHGFSSDAPTLFLSECFLIYLDVQVSDALIAHLMEWSRNAPRTSFLVYEQVGRSFPNLSFLMILISILKTDRA